MLPVDLAATIAALAALFAALASLVTAITTSRNAKAIHRVDQNVDGNMTRLADHLQETRRELAEAEEAYNREHRRRTARQHRTMLRRRPPSAG